MQKVNVPSSKSYANRALILGAINKLPFTISSLPAATDVTFLINCFKQIGLEITVQNDSMTIHQSFPECESEGSELDVGEGGTTARFLAAMLLLGNKTYQLSLGDRLKDRPWDDFIHLAQQLGGNAELKGRILTIKGPIHFPSELKIDCSKTTQFATAFQLIAPDHCKVIPVNMDSSHSYWKMTEQMMKDIAGFQLYTVPKDWSSAGYPLAFGALNQEIEFPGLFADEFQADSKFLQILKEFHHVTETTSGLKVHKGLTSGDLNFNVSDALDLVPTLAYYLAHIDGQHELSGIKNLIHKESDRLMEVIKLLTIFGRKASTDGNSLFIKGKTERLPQEIELTLPDDHRMVMAGTLFLLHHSGGSVAPADTVKKSYPGFFQLIEDKG